MTVKRKRHPCQEGYPGTSK